jgi:UDP-2,4-diacetamido-2,4,6-trideoxy-beta-L-altropyranose hydrolase
LKKTDLTFAFRVDASCQIGTGHLMRCLTLADALKKNGAQTRFISRHMPEYLRGMLAAKRHDFMMIDNFQTKTAYDELAHAHWLGTSQEQDAQDTMQALNGGKWDWLIVDHYGLDFRWESILRHSAKRIMVIDDLADRQHDCEVLLDQNLYKDMDIRYKGKVPPQCQLMLGPRYALLRDEFRQLHEQITPRSGSAKRILVFFGGVDANNFTRHTIEALSEIDLPDLHVDVVIGAEHPCREQILATCTQRGFICHVQTSRMAELMVAADLAIGAGGSTCWERCCLGLPALVISTADNQRQLVAAAASKGLIYSPELTEDLNRFFSRHIRAMLENNYLRQFISQAGLKLVDGRGTSRLIDTIGLDQITLQKAGVKDSESLFAWRNHPEIRKVSRHTNLIDWQDHQKWFSSMISDKKKVLLIGQTSGVAVGIVHFDMRDKEAEISIYLVPEKISSGLGRSLLLSAEQWLTINQPEISKLRAHVLGDNIRSQRLFSSAGYVLESTQYFKRLN